jgi:hypothetical protein
VHDTKQQLVPQLTRDTRPHLRLFAAAMIRNENDLILPFLRQCAELFDGLLVADIRSTDGTAEIMRSFCDPRLHLQVYEVHRQEKFQGALMNRLSREAFAAGADWVFLLDADEFLDVPDRAALERFLGEVDAGVLMLPWINLVPSHYGTYENFDLSQNFRWSGRASSFCKVALSSVFAAANPDYVILEGNHAVSPTPTADPIWDSPGLPILHVPLRSLDRFRAKIRAARRLTQLKHNRGEGDGAHVYELDDILARGLDEAALNHIAAHYGQPIGQHEAVRPEELGWPVRRLPAFVTEDVDGAFPAPASLSRTLRADAALIWDKSTFVKGTTVAAVIDGELIRIVPQPTRGDGSFRDPRYAALGPAPFERPPEELLIDVVSVSGMRLKAWVFSAWSELITVLYALFTVLRPRRFVELGVHNGMSFFAACQVAEHLGLETECVAVDSWIGDEHAGFHDTEVFDAFRAYLRATYPQQQYIQSFFSAAHGCFEEGSIDLLHIDGLHTYEAVKNDFETWLPKASDTGVIIFHDINVFERGFGVWRLWEELKERYPAYGFAHQHGLGIIYVGREPHPFAALLRDLAVNRLRGTLAQAYFGSVGSLVVEHRKLQQMLEEALQRTAAPPTPVVVVDSPVDEARIATLCVSLQAAEAEVERLCALEADLVRDHQAVLSSTAWRATWPVRKLLSRTPRIRNLLRRTMKLSWWTATGQLPRRLRERGHAAAS